MNERIKLLAEQSVTRFRVDMDGSMESDEQGRWISHDDVEKFAELIVAECSKVIVNGGYRNPALGEKHPLTPPEIATMIEEHFGVEE